MSDLSMTPEPGHEAGAREHHTDSNQIIAAPKTDGLDTVTKAEAAAATETQKPQVEPAGTACGTYHHSSRPMAELASSTVP